MHMRFTAGIKGVGDETGAQCSKHKEQIPAPHGIYSYSENWQEN